MVEIRRDVHAAREPDLVAALAGAGGRGHGTLIAT